MTDDRYSFAKFMGTKKLLTMKKTAGFGICEFLWLQ
jgi:hypothetical protein